MRTFRGPLQRSRSHRGRPVRRRRHELLGCLRTRGAPTTMVVSRFFGSSDDLGVTAGTLLTLARTCARAGVSRTFMRSSCRCAVVGHTDFCWPLGLKRAGVSPCVSAGDRDQCWSAAVGQQHSLAAFCPPGRTSAPAGVPCRKGRISSCLCLLQSASRSVPAAAAPFGPGVGLAGVPSPRFSPFFVIVSRCCIDAMAYNSCILIEVRPGRYVTRRCVMMRQKQGLLAR